MRRPLRLLLLWACAASLAAGTAAPGAPARAGGGTTDGLELVRLADSLDPMAARFAEVGPRPHFVAILSPT